MKTEVTLATIPGALPQEQLVVVLTYFVTGESSVSLRQQSWGEGVGWYDQKTVDIEPQQVAELRAALGHTGHKQSLRPMLRTTASPFRVLHAESA